MKIFPPKLEIGDTEGFSSPKDIFGRKQLGLGLAHLFSTVSEPMVLALDAPWGSGKSVFLRMLAGHLRQQGFPVVYFDAFEHDLDEDGFVAIAGQLFALADEMKVASRVDAFKERAISVAKVVGRSGLKVGLKLATAGALEAADLTDAAKEIGSEVSALTDKQIEDWLTKHRERKATISAFREALARLPAVLCPPENDGQAKPLIFIVDELDRCRPTFALDLLERIKHLFSVPNVHFVLGVHLQQLEGSVAAVYGERIDARQYLQKFVQLVMRLPEDRTERSSTAVRYAGYLRNALGLDETGWHDASTFSDFVALVARTQGLSLRVIEQAMTYVALAMAFTPQNYLRPAPVIVGLCILKVIRPDLYAKAKQGTLSYPEVRDVFDLLPVSANHEAFDGDRALLFSTYWWKYCTLEKLDDPRIEEWMRPTLFRFNVFGESRRDLIRSFANDMIDRLQPREGG